MPSFILRHLDPTFWARVQTKARSEGQTVKAVILRLLTTWLGAAVIVAAVVLTSACAYHNPTEPTPIPLPAAAPATAIELVSAGSATASHQVLFTVTVRDAIGNGLVGQRVTVSTTEGTLNYHVVTTGPSGDSQVILTTLVDALVTVTLGELTATTPGLALLVPPPPPSCATDASFCPPPVPPSCATDASLCPPPPPPPPTPAPVLTVSLTCTATVHGSPTPCNVNVSYGTVLLPATAITSVDWVWGDGFTNTTIAPTAPISTRIYASAGSYTVFVTVTAETADGTKSAGATQAVVIL